MLPLEWPEPEGPGVGADGLTAEERALVVAWNRDADLLLAERSERSRADGTIPVTLPGRLSVSSLVSLARDPAELARQVRRPMPRPPAGQARRGTAFHQWLEERYGQQRLIDDEDLFSGLFEDDEAGGGMTPDPELTELRAKFERGEWADRWPAAVEVPFETLVGDRQVRGRIDAVFRRDGDGGGDGGRGGGRLGNGGASGGGESGSQGNGGGPEYDVVDWKTGRPPRSADEQRAVAVQLAAYRLAWAKLAGVPVSAVRAAFYYVADDRTVRPADLLDETGLTALIEHVPAELPE
jgi:DNA helicase-2/ATP-dependent DNA helicase PcrA